MTNYRLIIATQDNEIIKEVDNFNPDNWTATIQTIEPRYDWKLTLQRCNIFDNESAAEYIKMNGGSEYIKANYPGHIILKSRVICPWRTIAEVNTKYAN